MLLIKKKPKTGFLKNMMNRFSVYCAVTSTLTGWRPKMAPFFSYALTLPNINQYSQLFYCQNQEKICNNTVTKDPTTPH